MSRDSEFDSLSSAVSDKEQALRDATSDLVEFSPGPQRMAMKAMKQLAPLYPEPPELSDEDFPHALEMMCESINAAISEDVLPEELACTAPVDDQGLKQLIGIFGTVAKQYKKPFSKFLAQPVVADETASEDTEQASASGTPTVAPDELMEAVKSQSKY